MERCPGACRDGRVGGGPDNRARSFHVSYGDNRWRERRLFRKHSAGDVPHAEVAHARASTAICCTIAYIFWRERMLPRPVAWLFAVAVPLLIGVSRLYLNVHWATDVLGGWSGGVLLALLSVILNRRQRSMTSPDTVRSASDTLNLTPR